MVALRRQLLSPVTQVVGSSLGFALALALTRPAFGVAVLGSLLAGRVAAAPRARRVSDPRPQVEPQPEPQLSPRQAEDAEAAALVRAYQAGDRSAFEELNRRYFDRILACARVTVRDVDEPDYVARRVFMRVGAALGRVELRRDLPFRLWLFRLARRTMLDARAAHLSGRPQLRIRGAQRARRAPRIRAAGLPASDHAALALGDALELSVEEIASELGRPPEAVRRLIAQGAPAGRGSSDRWPMVARRGVAPVLSARRLALRYAGVS
jgi:DNA-directed RNA polymerase specialized sigma24 family protein